MENSITLYRDKIEIMFVFKNSANLVKFNKENFTHNNEDGNLEYLVENKIYALLEEEEEFPMIVSHEEFIGHENVIYIFTFHLKNNFTVYPIDKEFAAKFKLYFNTIINFFSLQYAHIDYNHGPEFIKEILILE